MLVKFTRVEEFLTELSRDQGKIARNILRLTNLYQPSKASPNLLHLWVVATCVVAGDIVRLDRFCGTIWRLHQDRDKEVYEQAAQVQRELEARCQELGLEVRAGMFEEGEHAR